MIKDPEYTNLCQFCKHPLTHGVHIMREDNMLSFDSQYFLNRRTICRMRGCNCEVMHPYYKLSLLFNKLEK